MFDGEDRLRDCPSLGRLLEHYTHVSSEEASAWQERCNQMDGVTSKELVQLHGELLAHDWIEQNTHEVIRSKSGVVAACYRLTALGRRVLRLLSSTERDDEEESLSNCAA
jgi:hypothetical protein